MTSTAAGLAPRPRILLPLITALLLLGLAPTLPAHADANAFVIPSSDEDGYGITECMRSGSECGRVMADSWCEAHGRAKAIAFGSADDATGSISGTDSVVKPSSGDVLIRCGD